MVTSQINAVTWSCKSVSFVKRSTDLHSTTVARLLLGTWSSGGLADLLGDFGLGRGLLRLAAVLRFSEGGTGGGTHFRLLVALLADLLPSTQRHKDTTVSIPLHCDAHTRLHHTQLTSSTETPTMARWILVVLRTRLRETSSTLSFLFIRLQPRVQTIFVGFLRCKNKDLLFELRNTYEEPSRRM